MDTIKTWLPGFPGFYNTGILSEDFAEDIESYYDPANPEILKYILDNAWKYIDHEQQMIDTAIAMVNIVGNELKDFDFIESIEYENLYSPREYNFTNDSISVIIKMDLQALIDLLYTEYYDELKQYIYEKYRPCSGFIPYYSNHLDIYLDRNAENIEDLNHKAGVLLEFLMIETGKSDLLYLYEHEVYESMYFDYDKCLDDINDEFGIDLKEFDDIRYYQDLPLDEKELSFMKRLTGIDGDKESDFIDETGLNKIRF